jgi:hypothetical protein
MSPKGSPAARAHHFVPQCWLAGFVDSGDKTGKLWVTDLRRRKQWPSSPANTGHRRDFYRVSDSKVDPLYFEKAFAEIENSIAPILKTLDQEQRTPTIKELDCLLSFAAVMFARVPTFRPFILGLADSIQRSHFSKALENQASWAKALEEAGIPADTPGASYEQMQRFERGGYSLSAENEWYLYEGFKAADRIIPILSTRHWGTQISPSGSFIASDTPVALDGPADQKIGFKSADIVIFPVSRHVLLYATTVPVRPPVTTRRRIAAHNTFTMLTAEEQVYSHVPDFCWIDEAGNYQTDWRLFVKKKFPRTHSTGTSDLSSRTFVQPR